LSACARESLGPASQIKRREKKFLENIEESLIACNEPLFHVLGGEGVASVACVLKLFLFFSSFSFLTVQKQRTLHEAQLKGRAN
jgi:hypothetical protein